MYSISSRFTLCRILDLSEANIQAIPDDFFSVSILDNGKAEYVIFPRGLQRIGNNAFSNNYELIEVDLPAGVTIAPDAFTNTPVSAKIRR